MNKVRLSFLLSSLLIISELLAQAVEKQFSNTADETAVPTVSRKLEFNVKAWTLTDELGEVKPAIIDTTYFNYHTANTMDGGASPRQNLAARGLPSLERIFFERKHTPIFLFRNSFEQEYISPLGVKYFQTTIPYAHISYSSAGEAQDAEEDFRALFTINAGKRLNFGGFVNLLSAKGFYNNQAANTTKFNFWGSYIGERYSAQGTFISNDLSNKENGGIQNDLYILDPTSMGDGRGSVDARNIPVYLQDAYTRVKGMDLYFSHRYNLGFMRKTVEIDSLKKENNDTIEEFVPTTSFIHTLRGSTSAKIFIMKQLPTDRTYFSNYYLNPQASNDSTYYSSLSNTFAVSMREGFSKYIPFGLSAYVRYDIRGFDLLNPYYNGLKSMTDDMKNALPSGFEKGMENRDQARILEIQNSLYAGAVIERRQGKLFNFDAALRIGVLGYDAGNIDLRGGMQTTFSLFKEDATIRAEAFFVNERPNYYFKKYVSNHFIWNNTFNDEQRLRLNGNIQIDRWKLYVKGGVESIQNYLYFNEKGLPTQETSNVQIISVQAGKKFKLGGFHLDLDGSFQFSSRPEVIALPQFTLYGNLYFQGAIAKVLKLQIGVDCQYFTEYNAPAYQPATNQFVNQSKVKVGNYPLTSVYVNFHLKQTRFFVMYYHANNNLFGGMNYFSTPHHPINTSILKLGLSWSFLD